MIVITVANNKGGVSKTTTAVNMAYCMARRGERVLLVDMDSQANATRNYGITNEDFSISIYNLLMDRVRTTIGTKSKYKVQDAIIKTKYNVDLLPCDERISEIPTWLQSNGNLFKTGAEIEKFWKNHFPYFLLNIINELNDHYDRMIIDTPPNLEYNTKSALLASDYVVVPLELGEFEITGLEKFINEILLLKSQYGVNLSILGILVSRYDYGGNGARAKVEQELEDQLRNHKVYGKYVFNTIIYKNAAYREAAVFLQPAASYKKRKARSVRDNFDNFVEEVELWLAKEEAAVTREI